MLVHLHPQTWLHHHCVAPKTMSKSRPSNKTIPNSRPLALIHLHPAASLITTHNQIVGSGRSAMEHNFWNPCVVAWYGGSVGDETKEIEFDESREIVYIF